MVSHCGPVLVIEFLASIDPVSLPVLAALVFSLTLYPLGLMLGSSCSPCCDTPCGECETGKLPSTVTVTFDGYPDVGPAFAALFVSFESCFGSGATATPTTAVGVITGVTVNNGGSGYATLARVEPTITADGPGGSGADITVTLSEEADECGLPYWTISGLTVVDGGSGYTNGDAIVFTLGAGETELTAAFALIQTSRDEPELTIEPPEDTGTGATFTVSLTATGSTPQTWYISGVTVTNGGTGYSDGDSATVGLGSGDVEQDGAFLILRNERDEPELTLSGSADLTVNVVSLGGTPETWEVASITVTDGGTGYSDGQVLEVALGPDDVAVGFGSYLVVNTVRDEPTLFAQAQPGSGGAGAVLVVTVVQSGNVWEVSSIAVTNGGTGYANGEQFDILPSAGQTVSAASVTANVTGGVITSLTINNAGEYFLDTGVIDTVDVVIAGEYFKDTGIIDSVEILTGGTFYKLLGDIESISLPNGGVYYAEDPDGTPHVATVTVSLSQIDPSDGTGATFTVNVDDDPDSPAFGEIASVTVNNGGSEYEAEGFPNQYCMGEYMNGREIVLARRKFFGDPGLACQYLGYLCSPLGSSAWTSSAIVFEYRAGSYASSPESVLIGPSVSLTTNDAIANCSDFSLEFPANSALSGGQNVAFNNVTATVVSGGGSVEDVVNSPVVGQSSDEFAIYHPAGVCGSCCLNEEPVPDEITISIENLVGDPATSFLLDGDYVFTRRPRAADAIIPIGLPNATTWQWLGDTSHLGGIVHSVIFLAYIEPCSPLNNGGTSNAAYYPDTSYECGDTCYKKCRLVLEVNQTSGNGGFNTARYHPECACLDFPVCSPPAEAYTMLNPFGTPRFTATIS